MSAVIAGINLLIMIFKDPFRRITTNTEIMFFSKIIFIPDTELFNFSDYYKRQTVRVFIVLFSTSGKLLKPNFIHLFLPPGITKVPSCVFCTYLFVYNLLFYLCIFKVGLLCRFIITFYYFYFI